MANEEQLRILQQGVVDWNKWRTENPHNEVDLRGANLQGTDLRGAYLFKANLQGADFTDANLSRSDLRYANLVGAYLSYTNLVGADLSYANLFGANLSEADLIDTNLSAADLSKASLVEATLVRTKITDCRIYGISAWGLVIKDSMQRGLIITPKGEPDITIDNLQVAQFIYLLLHNEDIRQVIDTITSKAVLILGRFTPERKVILDAIRDELRNHNYLPVVFDFETPVSRDLRETISTLAHISRFVIADITDAKSIPAELEHIVPSLPSVPIMPLISRSDRGYSLFDPLKRYPWVIEPYRYEDHAKLIASIGENVIAPAEEKAKECRHS